jgi:ATP-dependent exoDNAse (exonuclease V) beta subunit
MSTTIADAAAREAALDPRRSFIVQAPAGSGKTELLVRRYSALLETVQKPEEIVAITFTIKAAAEMRARVLKKLSNSAEIGHRLRIQTIDAFCASLTRQMPVMSRFGAQPGVVEDAQEHYRAAAQRTIDELSPAACRLLLHLDNNMNTAASLIAAMLAKRDQWLRKTGVAPTRSELEASLQAERARILAHARSLHPKASPEFAAVALTKDKYTWRQRGNPVPVSQQNEILRGALESLLRMPEERYDDDQWETLGAILELLPRAAAHLKVVFGERSETDFTEIAQGAVRALGTPENPTDLLLALDTRIKHILVDEFQDTSYSQYELLERLTAGWEPGDGRTLFLVGDPMQSIYRFREAKVALFLQAWEQGLGSVKLERLTLTTNFRSQRGLVDWYNASFPHILPAQADVASGAVPYSPATPHHDPLPDPAVTWHHASSRKDEAGRIVDLVRNATGTKAILVRTREALAEIVPTLKAAGIRYRAIEIEHLGEKQVVQDLYALTRALLHLGDRIAWLSLLRAPWLALPLEKLLEIGEEKNRFKTIWELIKDDLFLADFTRIVAPAVANRERGSLRERVEGVWLALGGPACVADKTELEDAERYLDELEALEEQGPLTDASRLRDAIDRLYALPDLDATDDDLQIMTIHKAKGLEFGTVIVPGLDLASGGGDTDLLLFNERVGSSLDDGKDGRPREGGDSVSGGGLLLAPIKPTGAETDPTYRYLRDLNADAENVESSRLLYVAATRAEQRLHLMACLGCDKDSELKNPVAHSLLSRAWSVGATSFSPREVAASGNGTRSSDLQAVYRLARLFRIPRVPEPVRWVSAPERPEGEEIEFSWAGETARHVGTVVHHWLQRIADDAMHGWDARRVESLRPLFGRELQRRGIHGSRGIDAAALVADALKNSLEDERGRWLLGPHPKARSEHRLRFRGRDGIRSYVIDRLFHDAGGDRWIVDFKTSRHEGGGLQAFLDEQRARYEPQLNTYAAAFDKARRGLYFPLLRGWREWGN